MFALVFDTETDGLITTLAAKSDRLPQILSLCYNIVNLETGVSMKTGDFLFKPSKPIPEDMTKIHGITNEMVKDSPKFAQCADLLSETFSYVPLVIAHNARFDQDMLNIEMQRCERSIAWHRVVCTVEQTIWIKGYRLSLTNLFKELFNRDFEEKHSAAGDVAALSECCVELFRKGWL